MTTLLLIRHGQASFGSGDYDRLCDRGIRQSRLLGTHLAAEGRRLHAAVSGTLRRQADTARHALAAAGRDIPVATTPAFDEYPADALLRAHQPAGEDPRADRQRFQAALAGALDFWITGAPGFDGESWPDFRTRVRGGLDAVLEGRGKDDTVAVFTSGGVIGAAVGEALGLPPARAIALSWRVLNASVTEIHYGRSGFSLAGFNSVAHLRLAADEDLLTHR